MHVFIGFMVSALRERGLCVMLVRIWDGWVGGWGRLVGGWVSGWVEHIRMVFDVGFSI